MTAAKKHYTIVLVEPSAMIAAGFQELLRDLPGFEIVGVVTGWHHHAERIRSLRPDIIVINPSVIDYQHRQNIDGILAGMDNTVLVALLYQYMKPEELRRYQAVIDIEDDREKIIRKLSQAVNALLASPERNEGDELSDREKEILVSVAKGMINKEIADQHHISIHTVITHRKNITRKTGIKSVSGLTVYALLNNLISMGEVE